MLKRGPSELYLNILRAMVQQEQERIRRARGEDSIQWTPSLCTFTNAELYRWYALQSPR